MPEPTDLPNLQDPVAATRSLFPEGFLEAPEREERWEALKKVLRGNHEKSKTIDKLARGGQQTIDMGSIIMMRVTALINVLSPEQRLEFEELYARMLSDSFQKTIEVMMKASPLDIPGNNGTHGLGL